MIASYYHIGGCSTHCIRAHSSIYSMSRRIRHRQRRHRVGLAAAGSFQASFEPLEERSLLSVEPSFAIALSGAEVQEIRQDDTGAMFVLGKFFANDGFAYDLGPGSANFANIDRPEQYNTSYYFVAKYGAEGRFEWGVDLQEFATVQVTDFSMAPNGVIYVLGVRSSA